MTTSENPTLNWGTTRLRTVLIVAWVGVIAVLIVMAAISFASPPLGRDSSAFAYVAEGILAGEVPYLDRWDHKGPVIYLIYALGLLAPGWWGLWLINMAFLLGSAFLCFKTVQREFGTTAALFSVSTLLIYVRLLGGGLTEQYALLFQFLTLFLFLRAERKGGLGTWECIAIGVFGALSFLLRANLIGVWLAIGIFWTIRWRDARARIAWSAIGGLSVLAVTSLAFASLGGWGEFLDATITFNLAYSDATFGDRIRAALLLAWYLSPVVPLLGIGWCVGIWYHQTGKTRGEEFKSIWPFILTLGPVEVVLSLVSGHGFDHYYLALLPVGTLYLGFLVWLVDRHRLAAPPFLAFILIFATVNYHMDIYTGAFQIVSAVKNADEQRPRTETERDLRIAEVVKRNSSAEDTILVWGAETQIHLLTKRNSPTRFFYQYPLVKPGYTSESHLDEFMSDVTNGRPAVIIDVGNRRLPPLDEEGRREWPVQNRYLHASTDFQRLFDFVETEYDLIEEVDGFRVYVRSR